MGRQTTYPTTVEDCLQLSMKDLRQWGYLKPGSFKNGSITVSIHKRKIASYGIMVCMIGEEKYIKFNYAITRRNGEKTSILHKVPIVSRPANIGGGYRFYFQCPKTGKLCSKLYSPPNEDLFLHRTAFPYLIYDTQKRSKRSRRIDNGIIGLSFKIDRLERNMILNRPKYARYYYKGKPTKKMKKFLRLRGEFLKYRESDIDEAMKDFR